MDLIQINEHSDFSIHNLPFGIFSKSNSSKRLGVAYGDSLLDLFALAKEGFFEELNFNAEVLEAEYLNDFISLGKEQTSAVRLHIQAFLQNIEHELWAKASLFLHKQNDVNMHLPVKIGDYTDFYSSEAHARNVGMMFRDPNNALLPNWKHMPVAYHGRASSIFVSGTNFKRPQGQLKSKDQDVPHFGPTKRLDFELEMGAIIGKDSVWQEGVKVDDAPDYVFGFVLFNDWSARDIQQWEYVPLGPFLGKNFFSSISPWVVTAEALEPFKVTSRPQNPEPLPYLHETAGFQYDLDLEVYFKTKTGEEKLISKSNYKHLYWTLSQQIAHHTVNGCNLKIGDILASGTISGDSPDAMGSLLEITWGGNNPISFGDGTTRTFVEDGDSIIFKGQANKKGKKVGFGILENTIIPLK